MASKFSLVPASAKIKGKTVAWDIVSAGKTIGMMWTHGGERDTYAVSLKSGRYHNAQTYGQAVKWIGDVINA